MQSVPLLHKQKIRLQYERASLAHSFFVPFSKTRIHHTADMYQDSAPELDVTFVSVFIVPFRRTMINFSLHFQKLYCLSYGLLLLALRMCQFFVR